MGEKSKLIGEFGEKSIENLFKMIGWGDPPKFIEFKCNKENHKRTTHGIDFFFAYKSPLVDSVLKKINVSVKFSNNPYPPSPNSKFKEYFVELVTALDCFKLSPEYSKIIKSMTGYSSSEDIGLLFWLTNDGSGYSDLISKIANATLPTEYNYHSFYVVDNKRIDFIYLTLKYINTNFQGSDVNFFYPDTGKNIIPHIKRNYGKVLPVEFINSSLLPVRVEDKVTKQTTLILSSIDPFSCDALKRLISLSQELSKSWSSKIIICFPDYNELNNSSDVRIAKGVFEDESFINHISVVSYNDNFKSLQL